MIIFITSILTIALSFTYTFQHVPFNAIIKSQLKETDLSEYNDVKAKGFMFKIPSQLLIQNKDKNVLIAVLQDKQGDPNIYVSTQKITSISGWSSYGIDFNVIKVSQIKNGQIYAVVFGFSLPVSFKFLSEFELEVQKTQIGFSTPSVVQISTPLFDFKELNETQISYGQSRFKMPIKIESNDITHFTIRVQLKDNSIIDIKNQIDLYISKNKVQPDTSHFIIGGLFFSDNGFIFTCFRGNAKCFCTDCVYHLLLMGPLKSEWSVMTNTYQQINSLQLKEGRYLVQLDAIPKGYKTEFKAKVDGLQMGMPLNMKLDIFQGQGYAQVVCDKKYKMVDHLIFNKQQLNCQEISIIIISKICITYSLELYNQNYFKVDPGEPVNGVVSTFTRRYRYDGKKAILANLEETQLRILLNSQVYLQTRDVDNYELNCSSENCHFMIQVLNSSKESYYRFLIKQLKTLVTLLSNQPITSFLKINQTQFYKFTYSFNQNIYSIKFQLTELSGRAKMYSSLTNTHPDQLQNNKSACPCHSMIEWKSKQLAKRNTIYLSVKGSTRCDYILMAVIINVDNEFLHPLVSGIPLRLNFNSDQRSKYFDLILHGMKGSDGVQNISVGLSALKNLFKMRVSGYVEGKVIIPQKFQYQSLKNHLQFTNQIGSNGIVGYIMEVQKIFDTQAIAELTLSYQYKGQSTFQKLLPNSLHYYTLQSSNSFKFKIKSGKHYLSIACQYCSLFIDGEQQKNHLVGVQGSNKEFQIKVKEQQTIGIMDTLLNLDEYTQIKIKGSTYLPNGKYKLYFQNTFLLQSQFYSIIKIDQKQYSYPNIKGPLIYQTQNNQGTIFLQLESNNNWTHIQVTDKFLDISNKPNKIFTGMLRSNEQTNYIINGKGSLKIQLAQLSSLEIKLNKTIDISKCKQCTITKTSWEIPSHQNAYSIVTIKGKKQINKFTAVFIKDKKIDSIIARKGSILKVEVNTKQGYKFSFRKEAGNFTYNLLLFDNLQFLKQNIEIQLTYPQKATYKSKTLKSNIPLPFCDYCNYHLQARLKKNSLVKNLTFRIVIARSQGNQIIYPLQHNQRVQGYLEPNKEYEFSFYLNPFKSETHFIIFLEELIPEIYFQLFDANKKKINFNQEHNEVSFQHLDKQKAPLLKLICRSQNPCKYRIMLSQVGQAVKILNDNYYSFNIYPNEKRKVQVEKPGYDLWMTLQVDEDDEYEKMPIWINGVQYEISDEQPLVAVLDKKVNEVYHKQKFTLKSKVLYRLGKGMRVDGLNKVYSFWSSDQIQERITFQNSNNVQYSLWFQISVCDNPIQIQDNYYDTNVLGIHKFTQNQEVLIRKKNTRDRYKATFFLTTSQDNPQWMSIQPAQSQVRIIRDNTQKFIEINLQKLELVGVKKKQKNTFNVIVTNGKAIAKSFLRCKQTSFNRKQKIYLLQRQYGDVEKDSSFRFKITDQMQKLQNFTVAYSYSINKKNLYPKNLLDRDMIVSYKIVQIANEVVQSSLLSIILSRIYLLVIIAIVLITAGLFMAIRYLYKKWNTNKRGLMNVQSDSKKYHSTQSIEL